MSPFLWVTVGILGVAGVIGLGWVFHRVCTMLEEAGYLYYRKSGSGGGGGGVLYELDRLTRPSIEHVVEAQDTIQEEEEIDGD